MTVSMNQLSQSKPMMHACGPACAHCANSTIAKRSSNGHAYFGFKGSEKFSLNNADQLVTTASADPSETIVMENGDMVSPDAALNYKANSKERFSPLGFVKKLITGLLAAGVTLGALATAAVIGLYHLAKKGVLLAKDKALHVAGSVKSTPKGELASKAGKGVLEFAKKYGPKAFRLLGKVLGNPIVWALFPVGRLLGKVPLLGKALLWLAQRKTVVNLLTRVPGLGQKLQFLKKLP